MNYLGDTGADGTQPFSFRVPPLTNFTVLVSARATNIVCANYALELFGLPCPPPGLHIAKDVRTNAVRLQWSTSSPGFQLQGADALAPATTTGFSNVAVTPAIVGGRFTVTNSVSGERGFYRLAKP